MFNDKDAFAPAGTTAEAALRSGLRAAIIERGAGHPAFDSELSVFNAAVQLRAAALVIASVAPLFGSRADQLGALALHHARRKRSMNG